MLLALCLTSFSDPGIAQTTKQMYVHGGWLLTNTTLAVLDSSHFCALICVRTVQRERVAGGGILRSLALYIANTHMLISSC